MRAAIMALFGGAFFAATAMALGTLLLRALPVRLYRAEEWLLGFVTGSAVLSAIIFALCTVKLARKGVFLVLGATAILAVWRYGGYRAKGTEFPALPGVWRFIFFGVFGVFTVYSFFTAWAPENSPDGMAYHLWVVAEYARAHGFVRIPNSFFANLPQGLELLFLYGFVFGKHSAAALVDFSFLAALPFLILTYGRRFGFPRSGVAAGLFVFVAPVVGMDGSVAYVDVAVATIAFALFYLLQIWDLERESRLLIPVGILAGFAFAVKHTGLVAVLYAVGLVAWKTMRARKSLWRPVLVVGVLSLVFIIPWMLKNWLWMGNPVVPFANRWFPNPWVHPWFENDYQKFTLVHGLTSWKQAPLQLTVHGDLVGGIVGPLFLAAPLGLLALRRREGRQILLAAAMFLAPYFGNTGTRFLSPCLPFLSLALALALDSVTGLLLVVTLANAVACLPPVVNRYAAPGSWKLANIPFLEALRLKSEDAWLMEVAPPYGIAKLIEQQVPLDQKVYSFSPAGRAYTKREVMVKFESATGDTLGDILWAPMFPDFQPTHAMDFRFPAHEVKKLRLIQTADTNWMWSVSELRVYGGGAELARSPEWRLTARPNPWEVQLAFDNNPGTRWRSWQAGEPGMYIEIDFGAPRRVDEVNVQQSHDEDQSRYRVDGMDASGNWTTLSGNPVESAVGITVNLRRAATDEVKRRGYRYLLVDNEDIGADDFGNAAVWGLTLVGQRSGVRLYRID